MNAVDETLVTVFCMYTVLSAGQFSKALFPMLISVAAAKSEYFSLEKVTLARLVQPRKA